MAPLAIGQERSIRLVDDVVGGDRLLALVTVRDSEVGGSRLAPPLRDRDGRGHSQDDPRPRRDAADPRPGPAPDPARRAGGRRPVSRRALLACTRRGRRRRSELEALLRNAQGLFGRIIGLAPYLPEELSIAAANVDDAEQPLQPRRVDPPAQDRGEAARSSSSPTPRSGCARSRRSSTASSRSSSSARRSSRRCSRSSRRASASSSSASS